MRARRRRRQPDRPARPVAVGVAGPQHRVVGGGWLVGDMAKTTGGEPDGMRDLLAKHSDEVADLTRRLRAVARASCPELTERIYFGWYGVGLHHPAKGYVAALFPRADEVHVGFDQGLDLPDPYGLLQGDGHQVRYLVFRPGEARPTPDDLVEYLNLALGG
jgi:hypothetical protein